MVHPFGEQGIYVLLSPCVARWGSKWMKQCVVKHNHTNVHGGWSVNNSIVFKMRGCCHHLL